MDLEVILRAAEESHLLHLPYMRLSVVPPQIFRLKDLVRLDLGFNNIKVLPDAISIFTCLEQLWLNDNPLAALPASIEACTALRSINLQCTELVKLPKQVSRLPAVTEIDLFDTPLRSDQLQAYIMGGTFGLMEYLRGRDTRKHLKMALAEKLIYEVYPEEGASAAGTSAVSLLVKALLVEFPDPVEMRTVIRNAARVFPPKLDSAVPSQIRVKYEDLMRDNTRKQLAADLELKIRALYYDRIDVTKVEAMVNDILRVIPTLDDMQFLLEHAPLLFPREASSINGAHLHAAALALRAKLAEERAAAVSALTTAMRALYPDCEPTDVQLMAASLAAKIHASDQILALAADAAEVFPGDFSNARVPTILKSFAALQKEKGVV